MTEIPFKDTTHPVTVYLEDTDQLGMVYHANYLKFFERGRTEWLKQNGMQLSALQEHNILLVVSHLAIDYIKPASLDDELEVVTTLAKARHAVVHFNQYIKRKSDDAHLSRVLVKVVCIDKDKHLYPISKLFELTETEPSHE